MHRSAAAGALAALFALAAAPAFASATDDVRAGMMKFANLSSYEMSVASDGGSTAATMDFVKPDSIHMRASGMEMVRVGKTTYMKMGGQKWMKIPDTKGAGPVDLSERVRTLAKKADGVTATDLGMKSVDGEMLHAYRMKDSDGNQSTCYIARDGMVHRIDNGGKNGGTIRFSKFNQIARISAPI